MAIKSVSLAQGIGVVLKNLTDLDLTCLLPSFESK